MAEMRYQDMVDLVRRDTMPACLEVVNNGGILDDGYWVGLLVRGAAEDNSAKCLKAIANSNKSFKKIEILDDSDKYVSVYEFINAKNPSLAKVLK